MRTLRDIAAQAALVKSDAEAYRVMARSLERANPDLPFTCYYCLDRRRTWRS